MNKFVESKPTRLKKLARLFVRLAAGAWSGAAGWRDSRRLARRRAPLRLPDNISKEWHEACLRTTSGIASALSIEEQRIVDRVHRETSTLNRNNVTRTQAYWELYQAHPELHWALLAHLVSRNGGWSMTDLKGQWLPMLLAPEQIDLHFGMLESCNSFIFGDAYPQLKLYAESRLAGASLFRLLPHFGVSEFMRPFWERFLSDGDAVPLTVALIVNEQHFIQGRVVENPLYREHVLNSAAFRLQPLLQLNQVVFPVRLDDGTVVVAGKVLERFESLAERIGFGKSLYAMLFGYKTVLQGAIRFAESVSHTGSRADYWPCVFASKRKTGPKAGLPAFFYSPALISSWPNQPLRSPDRCDWFRGADVFSHFKRLRRPRLIAMSREHLQGQRKLEAAVWALRGRQPL